MLPQLARYLLQFHQVHVPSVGTIRLVQQPAALDVASKLIHPPHFMIDFSEEGWLTRHQLWHFGMQLHFDESATRDALQNVGIQLRRTIESAPFLWNGVGSFSYTDQRILFEPQQPDPVLLPVPAERVIRLGVQHEVRQGDQLVRSNAEAGYTEPDEKQWDWRQITGWAAVVLSVFFILFCLYQQQFQPGAAGLHDKIVPQPPSQTYIQ